jgi:hypothetical protein
MQPRLNTKGKSEDKQEEPEAGDSDRKRSTMSTTRSPSQPDVQMGCLAVAEEDSQKPVSPSAISNQRCVRFPFVSPLHRVSIVWRYVRLLPRHSTKVLTIEKLTCGLATLICC